MDTSSANPIIVITAVGRDGPGIIAALACAVNRATDLFRRKSVKA